MHLEAAMLYHYNLTKAEVESMPYPQILQYVHALLLINGNSTKWRNEDKAQSKADSDFLASLDL